MTFPLKHSGPRVCWRKLEHSGSYSSMHALRAMVGGKAKHASLNYYDDVLIVTGTAAP